MKEELRRWLEQANRSLASRFTSPEISEVLVGLGAVVLVLGVALWLSRLVWRGGAALESRIEGTARSGVRIQRTEVISHRSVVLALRWLVRATRLAMLVLVWGLAFEGLLAIQPQTRPIAGGLVDHLVPILRGTSAAVLGYIPNLLTLGLVGLATVVSLRLARRVFDGIRQQEIKVPGFYPEWARPTYAIVRLVAIGLGVVVAFPYLPGSESPAFRGVSMFAGVLVSIASTGTLSNAFAGTVLTYTRAFRRGDKVRIGETEGFVEERALFVTRLRTRFNEEVSLPNSMVLASRVVNYTRAAEHGLWLHTSVTIGYDAPWRQVHELLLQAAMATPGISADPAPFVLQIALSDFYVEYELNASTSDVLAIPRTYSELHQNIQDQFSAARVEIASPHLRAVRRGDVALPSPG